MLSATLHCCCCCCRCCFTCVIDVCLFVCGAHSVLSIRCRPAVQAPPPPPLHSPMSCDVVFSNQSGVLKHNTLTLGMLCQGGGHGQGRSSTLNFNLYNNTKHEPPAGRWLPLPPPPSANAVSIPVRTMNPGTAVITAHIGNYREWLPLPIHPAAATMNYYLTMCHYCYSDVDELGMMHFSLIEHD